MKIRQPASINLPHQRDVQHALLVALAGRHAMAADAAYRVLGAQFKLSANDQLASVKRGSSDSAWHYLVRQAKRHLLDEGYLECPEHGVWAITPAGRARAEMIVKGQTAGPEELGL